MPQEGGIMIRALATPLATTACIVALAAPAAAQTREFNIPAGSLRAALDRFARQSGRQVIYRGDEVRSAKSPGVRGARTADDALEALLAGTGFAAKKDSSGAFAVVKVGNAPAVAETTVSSGQGDAGSAAAESERADIVVTGTHISGVSNQSSPLIQLTQKDIERGGFTTTSELVRSIPQNLSAVTPFANLGGQTAPGAARNGSAGSAIDLRGLGASSTLILLNGHRLPASPPGDFVDISLIPLSTVERVDIVPDGASAIYGSDAVGGVVNFVLRRDFKGLEARASYGAAQDGGSEYRTSATAGTTWATGNIVLSYEHAHQDHLLASDRSFSQTVPSPTDLIPTQTSNSAFLSAAQDIGPVTLTVDGLYSSRSVRRLSKTSTSVATEYPSKQFVITPALIYRFAKGWQADLSYTYGRGSDEQTLFYADSTTSTQPRTITKTNNVELNVQGSLFRLPGGTAKIAVGGAYRKEQLDDPAGFFSGPARNVFAQYIELSAPLIGEENAIPGVRRLEMTAAARHEHYSQFGDTTNPKVGLIWEPLSGLVFRSSYGTSFRAATFTENTTSTAQTLLAALPDPAATSGSTLTIIKAGGSGTLKPERATTWTLGADYKPHFLAGLTLGVSYFHVDYKDRIAVPVTDLVNVLNNSSIYAPLINRTPTISEINTLLANRYFLNLYFKPFTPSDIGAVVDNQTNNVAFTRERGLDFSANYKSNIGRGVIEASTLATLLLTKENALTASTPFVSAMNIQLQPVDFRMRSGLSWTQGRWSASVFGNYVNGYKNTSVAPAASVSSWTTFDASFSIHSASSLPALKELILSVSVRNLFDRKPPYLNYQVVSQNYGFDPANADPLGRIITIELRKRF
jgi:iron complex outermembrane recepter protein